MIRRNTLSQVVVAGLGFLLGSGCVCGSTPPLSTSTIATPAASAQAVAAMVSDLAMKEPLLAERLGPKSMPWVTTRDATTNVASPPGMRGLRVKLPATGSAALEVGPTSAVTMRLTARNANEASLEVVGRLAIYRNMLSDTDMILINGPNWVEQLWLLRSPTAPRRLEFDVMLPARVREVRSVGDVLEFTDGRETMLRMKTPLGVDAAGKRIEARTEWTGQRIVVTLADGEVAWPVLVDPIIELAGWTRMAGMEERTGHAMAPLGAKIVLFGGYDAVRSDAAGSKYLNDTWEWDGATWTKRLPATAPPGRSGHAMATLGTKVVLFGGYDPVSSAAGETRYLNDTWEWDGATWTKRSPATSPPVRSAHAMATLGTKVLLFGGSGRNASGARTNFNDTWEWDGMTWTERSVATAPSMRYSHAMATLGTKVMLFGGFGGQGGVVPQNDTWEWDGTAWTQRMPPISPLRRSSHAMATLGTRVVLFGGDGDSGRFNDTWEWDGTTWTRRTPSMSPSALTRHAMATLGATKVVLFGGFGGLNGSSYTNDTWEWDGATWTHGASWPPASQFPNCWMATLGTKVVLVRSGDRQSWEWDGAAWTRTPATPPPSSAPIATLGTKVLLFGGQKSETWEWDGTTWTQRTPPKSPPARFGHAIATLAGTKVVLFGGSSYVDSHERNDTWEWDGTTWTERMPATSPSARSGHAMATLGAKVVLFGGSSGPYDSPLNDTWEWDGTTWTKRSPATSPTVRAPAMATLGTKVVLFGGVGNLFCTDGTWEWDGTTWSQSIHATWPCMREMHAMATLGARVVLFGGRVIRPPNVVNDLSDTWHYREANGDGAPCTSLEDCDTDFCVAGLCCSTPTCATGEGSTDAGGVSTDAGGVSTDAGGVSTEAGGVSTDAGGVSTDAGGVSTDAGGVATDAGGPATDAGFGQIDAGSASTDAGSGCGCFIGSGSGLGLFVGTALVLLRRRSRRV